MRDPLNVLWYHIKERCYNENSKSYKRYGGRGITVCDEWLHDSEAFKRWALSNGYAKGLEIDRIDNNRGYSPDNCRWVTKTQNARNTSKNRYISWNNEIHPLSEWCEILNLNYNTINMRLHRGWDFEKAVTTPTREWDDTELVGERFGRLVVRSIAPERVRNGRRCYLCVCDCGSTCVVIGKYLKAGRTKSCGCLQREYAGLEPFSKTDNAIS